MQFLISDENGRQLDIHTNIPKELEMYQLANTRPMVASDGVAIFYFQQLLLENCYLTYSVFSLARPANYQFYCDMGILDLQVTWKRELRFIRTTSGQLNIPEHAINLRFLPCLDTYAHFPEGETHIITVSYTPEYLHKYVDFFTPIERFLKSVEQQIPVHLSHTYVPINEEIREVLHNLIHNPYRGKMRQIYLEGRALQLLNLSIKKMGLAENAIVLKPADIDRLQRAKELIEEQSDDPPSLINLAHLLGTNDYKLKKTFKQYYGFTVFEHILNFKMDKALTLLKETEDPITDIAYATGYTTIHAFSKAFKKHYGYPPSDARKKE